MTREFAVPPVVFPSGPNPVAGTGVQQRRVPTAPFQPQRPSSSSIPFMSFDIGSAAASTSSASIYGGPIGGGGGSMPGSGSFEDEEPLLDELGIHPEQIWNKTKSILNPFRVNPVVHKDSDLSGPILLYMSLCLFQLLAGKLQFGVILGWIVVCSIFLYVVYNMLAGRNGNLDLHTCTSVIGYCLLPVVIFSAVSLFLPQIGGVRFSIAGIFVFWATRVSTALMVALADGGDEHRSLIAYIYNFIDLMKPHKPAIMGSVVEDPVEHDMSSVGLADMEDEDLFEINLEAVNSIPPPHYWDSYITATGNVLLANCLLPISDISSAVPIVSKDVSSAVPMVSKSSEPLSLAGKANFVVIAEPMPLGELLRLPFLGGFGVSRTHRKMKA